MASLAGKANSIATIFTLDIYKKAFHVKASEKHLVRVGKVSVIASMLLGVIISPFMGIDKKGGFQYIQEYTGFVSPGIFAMFLLGFFWKRTTSAAAVFGAVGGFALSVVLKFLPKVMDLAFLAPLGFSKANDSGVNEIPFLDRMGIVFTACFAGMILISFATNPKNDRSHGLEVDSKLFKTSGAFAVGALMVCGILAALYIAFW